MIFSKKMLITLVSAGLLLLFSLAAFIWVSVGLSRGEGRIAEISAKIASFEEERVLVRTLEGVFARNEAEIARIEKFFVKKDSPVGFVEELEGLASSTGVKLLINSVGDSAIGDILSLELAVEGSQGKVLLFLKLLELLPHDILVDDLIWKNSPVQSSLGLTIKTKTF